jgi:uncharacterized protein (TIGR03083 family)
MAPPVRGGLVAVDSEIQLDRLARSFAAVGDLIDAIQHEQWSAPTPCLDWTVHRLVEHLVGKNLVFAAVLAEQPLPQRGDGMPSCSTRLGNQAFSIAPSAARSVPPPARSG